MLLLSSLSPAEETALLIAAKSDNQQARVELLSRLEGLVRSEAANASRKLIGLDFDDFLQEGRAAIFLALNDFDTTRGTRFVTYAWYRIKCRMNHLIRAEIKYRKSQSQTLATEVLDTTSDRIATEVPNKILGCLSCRERDILTRFFGVSNEQESPAEIARRYRCSDKRIYQILAKARRKIRFHNPLGGE